MLLTLAFLIFAFDVQANQPQPWERKHEQLQQKQDAAFTLIKEVHAVLVLHIQEETPALLTQISIDPPEKRATGYQLLPEIRDDASRSAVVPVETFYSLKWLEGRLDEVLQEIESLEARLHESTDIESFITLFNETWNSLGNLEDHIGYHAKWQKAITRYPFYFSRKNDLVALARAMKDQMVSNGSPERIADLQQQLLQQISPFKPTPGLYISYLEDGGMVLPVTVCTDIEDSQFLTAFQLSVSEAFSLSSAAQAQRFSIELNWRMIRSDTLYGRNVPERGSSINMDIHYALFTDCPLVITTGASSLNARVGKRIFLGTEPVSRRTLAHEFGHLLGFEDAYLRGYDGDPGGPYGAIIVEWTGLSSDLMGDSKGGQVSAEMIEALVTAYGALLPK